MAIASLLLGLLAILLSMIAVFVGMTPVVGPYVGVAVGLAAPVAAIVGIVLGGVATSRAREEGGGGGLGLAGLIVSIVALFPAVIFGVSCGLCNLLCAGVQLDQRAHPERYRYDAGSFEEQEQPFPQDVPPMPNEPPPAFPPPPLPADPADPAPPP